VTYLLHILIILAIYIVVALSLNLVSGFAGLMNMAQAAFFGIGAYVAALLALNVHSGFWLNLVCAAFVAALVGLLVGWPALRIHDDYFVIASFGLQVIIFSVLNNWLGLTRGPLGLPGIPRPAIGGLVIDSHLEYLLLAGFLATVAFLVTRYITSSPYGRVLKAIREDEQFARSLGKNVLYFKLTVFAVGAGMAALAGGLYAVYVTFIDPTSFTISESIFMFSMVVIGGLGSLWGSVLGATLLIILPELLRFIGISQAYVANLRQMVYGALLIVMMFVRPQGLLGDYALGRRSDVFRTADEPET
jgi:branched-chain amino acid transport system permease protein